MSNRRDFLKRAGLGVAAAAVAVAPTVVKATKPKPKVVPKPKRRLILKEPPVKIWPLPEPAGPVMCPLVKFEDATQYHEARHAYFSAEAARLFGYCGWYDRNGVLVPCTCVVKDKDWPFHKPKPYWIGGQLVEALSERQYNWPDVEYRGEVVACANLRTCGEIHY